MQTVHTSLHSQVTFIPFEQGLSRHFENINVEWITEMFELEEIDKRVLKDPEKYIIKTGGHIWFASIPDKGIVGTCALLKSEQDEFELTKMGILNSARGMKVGEALLAHIIKFALHTIEAKKLYLLTNKKCEAAIHLYEKYGFTHCSEIMRRYGSHYGRCNVAMNFPIKPYSIIGERDSL